MLLQLKQYCKKIILLVLLTAVGCTTSKPPVTVRAKIVKVVAKPKPIAAKPKVVSEKANNDSGKIVKSDETQTLHATAAVKVTNAMVLDYIQKYKSIAKIDMVKFGIPASITLAQGILESGAGTAPLSMQANNHFGIKCHKDWTGPSVNYDDDSAQECFRRYNNPFESYNDHSLFLANRPRYGILFKFPKDDYAAWAKGLKDAGYATDVNYPAKLTGLIERYHLNQYDTEVLNNDLNEVIKNTASPKVTEAANTISSNPKYHIVLKGDTLYSLSKKYNISIETLKKKNNITETGISLGQAIVLE